MIAVAYSKKTTSVFQQYSPCCKTGGVDAAHCDTLIRLIEAGKLDTRPLLTHRMPLAQILEAYELFAHRPDSCIKVCVTP